MLHRDVEACLAQSIYKVIPILRPQNTLRHFPTQVPKIFRCIGLQPLPLDLSLRKSFCLAVDGSKDEVINRIAR